MKSFFDILESENYKSDAQKAEVQSIKSSLDSITEIYTDRDYIEISGIVGGDHVTFRVYNDGTSVER